ncbi:MAG: outer membrane protein transport protein [Rhodoferax sp.]|nr:outer membrane protein transport protein [Rhodoferax sp.]MDP3655199.1 outer membrane protein transport protein [Rhodoferax sp.]
MAAGTVLAGLFGMSWEARAALSENLGTSVTAMSLGNAVTADPPGLDAIHFNPAGLTRMKGRWVSNSIYAATMSPKASFTAPPGFDVGGWKDDPVAGTSTGNVSAAVYLPGIGPLHAPLPAAVGGSLSLSYNEPGSPWTFATGAYVTQGVGFNRTDEDDPGRFDGRKVIMQRLVYMAPSVGYKATDTLSFGVAVPIAHQGFALDTDMRMPNKMLGIVGKLQDAWCGDNGNALDAFFMGLCGGGPEGRLRPFNKVASASFDATAPMDPTVNLGVLWEPSERFAVGAVYQGGSDTLLTGRYTFRAEPMLDKFAQGMYSSLLGPIAASVVGLPTSIPAEQTGHMTMRLPFVEHVQVGVKVKPTKNLQINVDAGWSNWEKWDKLTMQFDQPIKLLEMARMFGLTDPSKLTLKRGYRNTISYGLGLQFQATDALTLRAGYEQRPSSIPNSALDLIAPLPDMAVKSLGLGYVTKGGLHIDVAASYAEGQFSVVSDGSCNMNCSGFLDAIYNPYGGLDVAGTIHIRYFGIQLTQVF